MLCIWWDHSLKPGETIIGLRCRTQLIRLKKAAAEKCPDYATRHKAIMTTLSPSLLFRLRTIWKTVDGKFYPTRLLAQTLPLLTTICSGRRRTPSLKYGSHQSILGCQAGAVLLGWDPQIARKMGKSHSFRWTIL